MTPFNSPPTVKELTGILWQNKIRYYEDEISGVNNRTELEIPLGDMLKNDSYKFIRALKISNDCALQGLGVVVSADAKLITITIKD